MIDEERAKLTMEQAEQLMRDFYCSPAYDPKAARHADVVKAAIAFSLATHPRREPMTNQQDTALLPVAEEGDDRFSKWPTQRFIAQCRMQACDNLDPEYSRWMIALAERLAQLSALQPKPSGEAGEEVERAARNDRLPCYCELDPKVHREVVKQVQGICAIPVPDEQAIEVIAEAVWNGLCDSGTITALRANAPEAQGEVERLREALEELADSADSVSDLCNTTLMDDAIAKARAALASGAGDEG